MASADQRRLLPLPPGWPRPEEAVLRGAMSRARRALDLDDAGAGPHGQGSRTDPVREGPTLEDYFAPEGPYAGTLFSTIRSEASSADAIGTADLVAVAALSMRLGAPVLRALLECADEDRWTDLLIAIPTAVPLQSLDENPAGPSILTALERGYDALRCLPGGSSNRWVLASKLLARKRPHLMPVRDNVVCAYLAGVPNLHGLPKQYPGQLRIDLQVFWHLMSDEEVQHRLAELHGGLEKKFGAGMREVSHLRLLDVALWCRAMRERSTA